MAVYEFEDSNGDVWRYDERDQRVYHLAAEMELPESNGYCGVKSLDDAINLLMDYGYIDEIES